MNLRLDDYCTFINGGSWTADEYANSGFPVLKVSNFDKDGISHNELSYLQESSFEKYKKNLLEIYDVVIATVGSHPSLVNSSAGRCLIISKDGAGLLLNQNAVCVKTKNENIINQRYLGYLCKSQIFQHFIQQRGKGAANQMRIPISGIKEFEFDFPSISTQRKIASILSAYDDLIENNLKRIKLLEEKAQRTYEEWFVKMRFPGYETAQFDKETGLPEGWKKVNLEEIATMKFGYAFKANLFNSEAKGMPIIRIRNIPSSNTNDYTTEEVDSKYIVRKGDLLIGMDGEFYVNTWSGPDAYLVQRVCNLVCKNVNLKGYLTEAIKHPIKIFQASIDGATVAHLGKKHLDQIEIVVPNFNIEIFNSILFEKINLSNQNQLLKEARDILLPRLMSGMIDVEKLEMPTLEKELNNG